MDGEAPSPAANHLFEVNNLDTVLLEEEHQSVMYNHNVAKMLSL